MTYNVFDDEQIKTEYIEHMDLYHNIQRQLFDTLDEDNCISECVLRTQEHESNNDIVSDLVEVDVVDELYKQPTREMCNGVNVSVISATIVLVNMVVIHGMSNLYMNKLLKYLLIVLLPMRNMLSSSHYKAKKLIRKLGLNYNIIHACPNGCVFC